MVGTVTFFSSPEAGVTQEVYFDLGDDLTALEGIEMVTLALNVSGAERISLGDLPSTLLNILDNDGIFIL